MSIFVIGLGQARILKLMRILFTAITSHGDLNLNQGNQNLLQILGCVYVVQIYNPDI